MTKPKYRYVHIHFQNKLHMYGKVITWVGDMQTERGSDAVLIGALDLRWNPLVRRYKENGRDLVDTSAVDRAEMEGRDEQILYCGDCLLAIREDLMEEFHQFSRDIKVEFGPHDPKKDGPTPKQYKHYFGKTIEDLREAYPFPEYVRAQGTWPKPEEEE